MGVGQKIAGARAGHASPAQRAELKEAADAVLMSCLKMARQAGAVKRLAPMGKNDLRRSRQDGCLIGTGCLGGFLGHR